MKRNGFTLLEMVIAAGLAAIVGTLLVRLWISNNGLYYDQTAQVTQGLGLNTTVTQLEADIKSSSGVASSYTSSSTTYTSSLSTLVLKIPSIDSSNNPIASTYDYIVYSQDTKLSQILRRQFFAAASSTRKSSNQVMLTNLSLLNFFYLDLNEVPTISTSASKISFVINAGLNGNKAPISSASSEVNLRNE